MPCTIAQRDAVAVPWAFAIHSERQRFGETQSAAGVALSVNVNVSVTIAIGRGIESQVTFRLQERQSECCGETEIRVARYIVHSMSRGMFATRTASTPLGSR